MSKIVFDTRNITSGRERGERERERGREREGERERERGAMTT